MDEINYIPLFVIFSIAWLVPLLHSWLKIRLFPAVIIEIIMGVIVGPYALDLIAESPYLDFMAYTGFLFLIFLSGLEIDLDKIMRSLPSGRIRKVDLISNSFFVAVIIYFGSLLLSLPFAIAINMVLDIDIIFLTILLPSVALSITVPILKADGILGQKFGQIMLMEGAIATIMTIILIAVYSGVLSSGFRPELLLFVVIFVVFFVALKAGKWLTKVRTFQKLLYNLEHAASQIRVRGTVALLLFFVVVASAIETEEVMGAFFGGLLLSLFVVKERSSLLFKIDGMGFGFFIPIFFINVGINLELVALANFGQSIPLISTLLLGIVLTQVIPSLILVAVFGWRKAMAGGILLTARLGLTIATAQIGLSLGLIDDAQNAGIVAASILICFISPVAYKLFHREKEEHFELYIIGDSMTSRLLSERIKLHGLTSLSLVSDPEAQQWMTNKGIRNELVTLDESTLSNMQIRTSDYVILLNEDDALNHRMADFIKNTMGHERIITLGPAEDGMADPQSKLRYVDANETLANQIEDMILRPDAISELGKSFGIYRVEEINVNKKSVHRKQVKSIAFPPSGSLVMIRRNNDIFVPHGDTAILMGDVITVIGNDRALIEFREIFEE